jgi:Histidine kinase-like ATPase domain
MDTAHGDATTDRGPAPGPYGRTSADQVPAVKADQDVAFRSLGQGDPTPAALAAGMAACSRWRRPFRGVDSQLEQLRRWLESLLPASPARDELVLVATELGTNAVRHTATGGQGGQFVVEVIRRSSAVRVIVADDGAATEPHLMSDPLAESGRGLLVVQALAERTGVCGDHRGRQVWADIPWPDTAAPVIRAERPDATGISEPGAGHGSVPDPSRGQIGLPAHGAAAWHGPPVRAAARRGGRRSRPAAVAPGACPPPGCRVSLRDGHQIAVLRPWLPLLPPCPFRGHLTCVVVGPAAPPGGLPAVRGPELPGRCHARRTARLLPDWAADG